MFIETLESDSYQCFTSKNSSPKGEFFVILQHEKSTICHPSQNQQTNPT